MTKMKTPLVVESGILREGKVGFICILYWTLRRGTGLIFLWRNQLRFRTVTAGGVGENWGKGRGLDIRRSFDQVIEGVLGSACWFSNRYAVCILGENSTSIAARVELLGTSQAHPCLKGRCR